MLYAYYLTFTNSQNSSDIPTIENSKRALRKLSESGMKKINFAGGEPFLYPKYLAELMDFWQHVKNLYEIAEWCHQLGIKFKLNTVVNAFNWEENMNEHIEILAPFRWKCFQVLILENENGGFDGALRDARRFKISTEQFEAFVERHKTQKSIVKEPNNIMKNSYLILDEYLRFLNCTNDEKVPSDSLLDVDVDTALQQAGWDESAFFQRQGIYNWSKLPNNGCTGVNDSKKFDW
ncbi:1143_t:CDS:2 [Gigaspora margarita]|uniref:1143_t:CDS:1 n=1 Tax=Gigaspora margarita TaxID=4874 RepID=A0ABM8W2S0_GIGMA|nr:1143_t:CDS:2 [Gigaspora margarita]